MHFFLSFYQNYLTNKELFDMLSMDKNVINIYRWLGLELRVLVFEEAGSQGLWV